MPSPRHLAKSAVLRLLRPALAGMVESQRRVEVRLAEIEKRLPTPADPGTHAVPAAVWRGGADGRAVLPSGEHDPALTRKLRGELDYWLSAARGADPAFPTPAAFHAQFDRWQHRRLRELAVALGLAADYSDAADAPLWGWCAAQRVVEIGGGPHPAIAAAMRQGRGWRSAVLADPLADAYVVERLTPEWVTPAVALACPGESIPLASGTTDLVIIENCLDHVVDPAAVLREIHRLLRPGGLLWLLVDTGDYRDEMHPHPMSEARVRTLLGAGGFSIRHLAAWKGANSHPRAEGQVRVLAEKPAGPEVR